MRKRLKQLMFRVLALVFVLEACSYLALAVVGDSLGEPIWRTPRIYSEQSRLIEALLESDGIGRDQVDPHLGWRYRSGYTSDGERISAQGLRSDRLYAESAPDDTLRIAAFGDSFVYGMEVSNHQAWPYFAERRQPAIELLNYGVGGYGTDQALLRYRREGHALSPEVVVLSFTPVDMRRNVSVYRRFIDVRESLAVKPRFVLAEGELELLVSPVTSTDDWRAVLEQPDRVREWGEHDQFFEPAIYDNPLYDWSAFTRLVSSLWVRVNRRSLDPERIYDGADFNTSAEAFRIQIAIYAAFLEEARAAGQEPILLLLPERSVVTAVLADQSTSLDTLSLAIAERLGETGLVVDASAAFAGSGLALDAVDTLFAPGGHYSELGNRIVGEWLADTLWNRFRP